MSKTSFSERIFKVFFSPLAPNLSPLSRNGNCRFLGAPGNFSAIQASRASLQPTLASVFQFQRTDGIGVQSSLPPRRSQPLLRSTPGRERLGERVCSAPASDSTQSERDIAHSSMSWVYVSHS